jgi:hypothetical protein
MNKELINFMKNKHNPVNYICLHEPVFRGNKKKDLEEFIDSTYVSSVDPFVDKFDKLFSEIKQTNQYFKKREYYLTNGSNKNTQIDLC